MNVVVPYAVEGKSATVLQIEYLGVLSNPVTLPVTATTPGIFSLAGSGRGPGAILNAKDESVNTVANPAGRGDWVSIFATGSGVTTPASVDGFLAGSTLAAPDARVSVMIGGLPCQVNYAGAAPGFVSGLLQINAQIPGGVTPGPGVPVQIGIGANTSPVTVTLAVQ